MEIQLLNLLVPDELPTQHKLSEVNKEKVSRSLTLTRPSTFLFKQPFSLNVIRSLSWG